MGYLVQGRFVLADQVIRNGAVAVEEDAIVEVGLGTELERKYTGYEKIGDRWSLVMPGLVNCHTHAAMTMLRGYAEDMPLFDWLSKKIWPLEAKLTGEDIYLGAKLAATEALLSGTTTLNSMYFFRDDGDEAQAFFDTGIRGIVGHAVFEWTQDDAFQKTRQLFAKWHGKDAGRIRVSVCPHAPYTVGPKTFVKVAEMRKELSQKTLGGDVLMCVHLAESSDESRIVSEQYKVDTSQGVINYLNRLGVLDSHTVAAHCVHPTDVDLVALKDNGVSVVSNPVSNLKMGRGVAPLLKMIGMGLNVSLGTDGASSNNSLDMFETMKITPLLQKGLSGDTSQLPAEAVFKMATWNGAKALHMDDVGRIEKGFKADLVVLDLRKPGAIPVYDGFSHVVYAAKAGDVQHVIVNGRLVVKDSRVVTVDVPQLLLEVEEARLRLMDRAGVALDS